MNSSFRRFVRDRTLDVVNTDVITEDGAGEFAGEVLDLPHAQAVIPGGRLDRGLGDGHTAASA